MKKGLQHGQQIVEDKDAKGPEPGSAEAIPQVGMIHDQRQDVGKVNVSETKGSVSKSVPYFFTTTVIQYNTV
jgi:hypothetical protein